MYFRRTIGRVTKNEAERLRLKWMREAERLGCVPEFEPPAPAASPGDVPFSAFAKRFVDDHARVFNKPSTVTAKVAMIKNHLAPYFQHRPMNSIRRRDVEEFVAAKVQEGLSPKSVNNLWGTLSRLLRAAVEWEVIDRSPMLGVRKLKLSDPSFDFYDEDETRRFLDECLRSEPKWHPFFAAAFMTGARLGELAALRWGDIDLERGIVLIRRAIWRGCEGSTKSGRNRYVPINAFLADVLARHRRGKDPNGRVFLSGIDDTLTCNSHRKPFARVIKRADLKRIRFHDLRHSFASQLVMRGTPLRVVQELLGHATVQMTERYSHLYPTATRDAVEALGSGFRVALEGGVVVPFPEATRVPGRG
ncbi:MAG: site-specific integrase [Deltaproteobacteria bacterium]|nr:site-specific integrase [Deltaproteobacteria bacterium]